MSTLKIGHKHSQLRQSERNEQATRQEGRLVRLPIGLEADARQTKDSLR
jgi:hypothetical protein